MHSNLKQNFASNRGGNINFRGRVGNNWTCGRGRGNKAIC